MAKNFVQEVAQLRQQKSGNLSCQGSKRFSWSAPVVAPRANERTDLESVAKSAPKPVGVGTLSPAAANLAAPRGMVAEARAAKMRTK